MNAPLRTLGLALFALLATAPAVSAQNLYTWTGSEATMTQRLLRLASPSVAGTLKAFPGTQPANVSFTTFTFTNTSASTQTFSAQMFGETGNLAPFFSLYLSSFNPANLATGYLGDAGNSCVGGTPCSVSTQFFVNVLSGQTVVLVANTVGGLATRGSTFTWNGGFGEASVVPEPSTYALMATGLVGLTGVARRRRQRNAASNA